MLKEKLEKLEKASKATGEDVDMEIKTDGVDEEAVSEQKAPLQKRLNQLQAAEKNEKALPEDFQDETRFKKIQEGIRDCKIKITKLQPPAKRRADLEEELRKAELFVKGQLEQFDKQEK